MQINLIQFNVNKRRYIKTTLDVCVYANGHHIYDVCDWLVDSLKIELICDELVQWNHENENIFEHEQTGHKIDDDDDVMCHKTINLKKHKEKIN